MTQWRIVAVVFTILMMALMAGCIQPANDTTPTPALGGAAPGLGEAAGGPALDGAAAPAAPGYPQIEQFIRDRGHTPSQLVVWYEQPREPDRLQGFSYQTDLGSPCAGFLLTSFVNNVWQPTYGAQACAADAASEALAGVTFFPTSAGEVFTVVFGRVTDPAVSAVAVVFDDGTNQTITPAQGGFLVVRSGVHSVALITGIDAEGYTVIENIPQTPV